MDGITLYYITKELDARLCGARIDKVQQPERDEIILTLRCPGENLNLLISSNAGNERIHLTRIKKANPLEPGALCMLLRKHIIGGRITAIQQINGDRIVAISIEHTDELGDRAKKTIICELMGKHSNIVLLSGDDHIIECARHINESISSFREVLPGLPYVFPPEHGKLVMDAMTPKQLSERLANKSGMAAKIIQASVSALSMPLAQEAAYRVFGDADAYIEDAQNYALAISDAIRAMLSNPLPHIILGANGEYQKLAPFKYKTHAGQAIKAFETLSEAADDFYALKDQAERIRQKSASLTHVIKNNMERVEKKLALQQEAFDDAANSDEYRIKGEMLTASPHLVKKGMKKVELPNYYNENCAMLSVELDEKLDAQANAQRYFKLYKKAQVARKLAKEQLESGHAELDYLDGLWEDLALCNDESSLSELRTELIKTGYIKDSISRRQMKALPSSSPMEFTAPDGTRRFVGRNNTQNEALTFSAEGNEIWLHAKNVPGSHVIIKSASPTDETLLFAASLAAAFSKGKNNLNVEVDIVPRKFLRKPAGAKPGFVTYTHQRTVFVRPYKAQ